MFQAANVTSEGLIANGASLATWDEIADARFYSLFGLPYIIVTRRGRHFFRKNRWVPLYTGALEKLIEDAERIAPVGNPFRAVLLNYRHLAGQSPQIQYLRFFVICNFALSIVAILLLGFFHFVILR